MPFISRKSKALEAEACFEPRAPPDGLAPGSPVPFSPGSPGSCLIVTVVEALDSCSSLVAHLFCGSGQIPLPLWARQAVLSLTDVDSTTNPPLPPKNLTELTQTHNEWPLPCMA